MTERLIRFLRDLPRHDPQKIGAVFHHIMVELPDLKTRLETMKQRDQQALSPTEFLSRIRLLHDWMQRHGVEAMTNYDRVEGSKCALVGLVKGDNEETLCRLGPELPDWVYPYLYELNPAQDVEEGYLSEARSGQ